MIPVGSTQDIADALLLLRQLSRLSQSQVGDPIGMHFTMVSRYERGGHIPGPRALMAILGVFGYGLAIVPLHRTAPETALSASVSAEHGPEVDREGVGGSNGCTGHTEAVKLLRQALHLRTHGERAPGGTETWADWDRRAETLLRGVDRHEGGEA